MDKTTDCIVLGGGFAGLAAAAELANRGASVVLLEPRPYLGGRARSFVHRDTGEIIDNGQHLLMGCYTHTLSLLRTLGTGHLLAAQPRMHVDFIDPDGAVHAFNTGRLPGKAGAALGLALLSGLSAADKLRAVRLALMVERGLARPGDETVEQFLARYRQPSRVVRRFWEPIVLATLNAGLQDAAAQLLVAVLQRAFFADARSSQLLFPAAGLSELTAPFPEWFRSRGGRIVHTAAESLIIERSTVHGVATEQGMLYADAVVSCIPPRALARLTDGHTLSELQMLADVRYSPIVSVYLWFDRNFLDGRFYAMLDTTIQWIFNRRLLCEADDKLRRRYPGHVALTVSAADPIVAEPAEHIVGRCLDELRRAFPAARSAELLHAQVIKEKNATMLATPDINRRRPGYGSSLGNLFLAGDWTNTGLPATIEGACQSGVEAARAVLARG